MPKRKCFGYTDKPLDAVNDFDRFQTSKPSQTPCDNASYFASMPQPNSTEIETLRAAYAAFNARDIDAALARMTDDVAWPRAFKGGFVRGPAEVRAYWSEQWSEIDPNVEPTSFQTQGDGRITVAVHQIVRALDGTVLADEHTGHLFTLKDGLIAKMEVCELAS